MEKTFKLSRFIRSRKVVWYGPHECNGCGATIIKSSIESGGIALDAPHGHHYPNHRWVLHQCAKPEQAVSHNHAEDCPADIGEPICTCGPTRHA